MNEQAEEVERAERFADRLAQRAIAMDGTCTGEHGVGQKKIPYVEAELGAESDRPDAPHQTRSTRRTCSTRGRCSTPELDVNFVISGLQNPEYGSKKNHHCVPKFNFEEFPNRRAEEQVSVSDKHTDKVFVASDKEYDVKSGV